MPCESVFGFLGSCSEGLGRMNFSIWIFEKAKGRDLRPRKTLKNIDAKEKVWETEGRLIWQRISVKD